MKAKVSALAVALILAALAAFASTPQTAEPDRIVCEQYGNCTICDFYGPDGEWQGYIEWCS